MFWKLRALSCYSRKFYLAFRTIRSSSLSMAPLTNNISLRKPQNLYMRCDILKWDWIVRVCICLEILLKIFNALHLIRFSSLNFLLFTHFNSKKRSMSQWELRMENVLTPFSHIIRLIKCMNDVYFERWKWYVYTQQQEFTFVHMLDIQITCGIPRHNKYSEWLFVSVVCISDTQLFTTLWIN